jgi:hypothetical protein
MLVDAVIDMLADTPVASITTRAIGRKIAMDPQVIFRNFGSLNNLLIETSKEMGRRFSPVVTPENLFETMGLLLPRYTLLTYLLGSGVPGSELILDDQRLTLEAVKARPEFQGLPDRLTNAMAIVSIFVLEGLLGFLSVHPFSHEEVSDANQLFGVLTRRFGELGAELGWESHERS